MIRIPLFPILFLVVFLLISCRKNPANGGGHPPTCCDRFDFRLTDYEPAWSPDGKTIAYVHGDSAKGKSGIYLIDPSGNNKRLFYASPGAYSPTWSPDGQWLAFSDGGQIFKMKINGDSLTQLTSAGRNFFPAWGPDGQWIAYDRSLADSSGPAGIWVMKNNGTMKKALWSGSFPTWNPNGNILIGVIGTSPTSPWTRFVRYNFSHLTSLDTLNAVIGNENIQPIFSPDGTKIVFTSQAEGAPPQIWVMDSDGSHPRQLTTTQGYTCDWSPDGGKIVYTDSRAVSGRLWIMNSDGSGKRKLTFDE